MRIGITGGNGFIGNHLLRSCIARGHRPILFLQKGSSIEPIQDLEGSYEAVWGDLLDFASLDSFLSRCDHLFHLAGYNRYWAADPRVFAQVNIEGVRHVAAGCIRHGIKRLVHASSCITLGASDEPIARGEKAEFNLAGIQFAYAETKKAGDDEIRGWVRERGLEAVIVHPTSAVGEQDYGPTPIGKPIADICRGRWPVYVAGGACFIDVHDVVRGLWLALEKGRVGESYLLAGDNLTNREFMSRVARCAGVAEPRLKVPRAILRAVGWSSEWMADRVTHKEPVLTTGMSALIGRYLYFDGSKARAELGFEPGPSLAGIERAVEWFGSRDRGPIGLKRVSGPKADGEAVA